MQKLGLNIVYLCADFDDFSFCCSRDIIGAPKFKMGHMTLTMPLLRVMNVKKLQFIHTVNGDGSKTAKIIKRQC